MNRAWIPAGALAGVSVAGLLALGPVTDSLSTPVEFASICSRCAAGNEKPKVVRAGERQCEGRRTAPRPRPSKPRGGQAAASTTNTDTGFVANRRSSQQPSTQASSSPPPPPAAPPAKKAVEASRRDRRHRRDEQQRGLSRAAGPGLDRRAGSDARQRHPLDSLPERSGDRHSSARPAGTIGLHGAIAQLGERLDRTQEVSGSSPLSSIGIHAVSGLSGATEKASGALLVPLF